MATAILLWLIMPLFLSPDAQSGDANIGINPVKGSHQTKTSSRPSSNLDTTDRLKEINSLKDCDLDILLEEIRSYDSGTSTLSLATLLSIASNRVTAERFHDYWTVLNSLEASQSTVGIFRAQALEKFADQNGGIAALRLAEESFGEGVTKNSLINALFSAPNLTTHEMHEMWGLLTEKQKEYAASGLITSIARSDSLRLAESLANNEDKSLSSLAAGGVAQYITYSSEEREINARFREFSNLINILPKSEGNDLLSSTIENLSGSLSGKYLESFTSEFPINATLLGNLSERSASVLAEAMVKEAPTTALNKLATTQHQPSFSAGFFRWLQVDHEAAERWLDLNRSTLSPELSQAATGQASRYYAASDDLDTAKALAEAITDPTIRNSANSMIWEKEKEAIHQAMQQSPEVFVDSLFQDQTKLRNGWANEAVYFWISKDFDGAEAWYDENSSNFNETQLSSAAFAFAKHACDRGDTLTAQNWLGYIIDQSLRNTIIQTIRDSKNRN